MPVHSCEKVACASFMTVIDAAMQVAHSQHKLSEEKEHPYERLDFPQPLWWHVLQGRHLLNLCCLAAANFRSDADSTFAWITGEL